MGGKTTYHFARILSCRRQPAMGETSAANYNVSSLVLKWRIVQGMSAISSLKFLKQELSIVWCKLLLCIVETLAQRSPIISSSWWCAQVWIHTTGPTIRSTPSWSVFLFLCICGALSNGTIGPPFGRPGFLILSSLSSPQLQPWIPMSSIQALIQVGEDM